jgi:hypothetical protein
MQENTRELRRKETDLNKKLEIITYENKAVKKAEKIIEEIKKLFLDESQQQNVQLATTVDV